MKGNAMSETSQKSSVTPKSDAKPQDDKVKVTVLSPKKKLKQLAFIAGGAVATAAVVVWAIAKNSGNEETDENTETDETPDNEI